MTTPNTTEEEKRMKPKFNRLEMFSMALAIKEVAHAIVQIEEAIECLEDDRDDLVAHHCFNINHDLQRAIHFLGGYK